MIKKINSILITGSNRGIGLEFVRTYANEDVKVIATCRSPEKASELNKLANIYPNISIFKLDVTNSNDLNNLSIFLNNEPIDLLINNAGIYGDSNQDLDNLNIETLQATFLSNAIAPLYISRRLLANIEKGQFKTIVAMSTLMGSISDNTMGGYYAYRSSKTALNMMMKNLSIDLRPKNIKVLILHPGWVQTDMGGKDAPLSVSTSVAGMRKVIESATIESTGRFYAYSGNEINW